MTKITISVWLGWLLAAAVLTGAGVLSAASAQQKKIVLIAGPITGHPKDAHEYEKSVILLKHLLDTSPGLQGKVKVEAHFKGWPQTPDTLNDADTIVLISDGSDRNPLDHPLYVGDRLAQLERQMKRGCGFMQFHWATFNPVAHQDKITEWVGGYFDYETGPAPTHWRSAITTKDWVVTPAKPAHPICRGVKPFNLHEEFYHHLRFRDGDQRLEPIVSVGPNQNNEWTVGWAVERADGGRGFGFTGGHFYDHWWNDDFRKLMLNAIVWTARLEVPAGGVESTMEKKIKALILTGHHHPGHDWKALSAALVFALEQDPRMVAHVSENIEDLATAKIDGYDLLVLNYNNWERAGLSEAAKENFLKYLKKGELPIEPLATAFSKITQRPEPMAWAYSYEKARVFQTVLGHADQSVRKAAALIRRGCVWAAGREQLSFDPPAALTEGALFREGSQWSPGTDELAIAMKSMPASEPIAPMAPPRAGRPGEHAAAGRDVSVQGEKDWVDNRWSQTDVGQFLASTIVTPNGAVAKGLSIRIGEHDEASVCYDTGQCALRAGWTGGFLRFDPARFGLIRAPQIEGEVKFLSPPESGLARAMVRYEGLRLNGKRVVLSWRIGETLVRESPWFESVAGANAFTRTLELEPGGAVTLELVEEKGGVATLRKLGDSAIAALEKNGRLTAVACLGDAGVALAAADHRIRVSLPPRTQMGRCKFLIWSGHTDELADFEKILRETPPASDLTALSRPGGPRWLPALTTVGQVGLSSDIFAIDTLTVPYENPWKALMFLAGVDFLRDGTAFVCSIHGDVWRVTGLDDRLRAVTWKRFATGLFQPLGLRVVDDKVYVLGRDQITRLHDENGDGEADFYENFCNLIETSTGGHEYVTSLETDAGHNFYYVDPKGAHRVSSDGRTNKTLATGFRNPNGLGAGPNGIITVTPQQGEWTPSSAICEVESGGYYGYPGPKVTPERPLGYDPPLCWIPHSVDNSSSSQVWVPSGMWGPLSGQALHLAWGRCAMMLLLRDGAGAIPQGAVIALPGRFLSGPMRGNFRQQDGQLYVAGSTGWQTSAAKDGSLQRVRYTGKPVYLPVAYHVHSNGLSLTFSQPLERKFAEDTGSYGLSQWNYRYAAQYGSDDWSVAEPSKKGHDPVEVKSARLLADGRTVFLEIPGLRPVMQMEIKYNLDAIDRHKVRGTLYATVNQPGPKL